MSVLNITFLYIGIAPFYKRYISISKSQNVSMSVHHIKYTVLKLFNNIITSDLEIIFCFINIKEKIFQNNSNELLQTELNITQCQGRMVFFFYVWSFLHFLTLQSGSTNNINKEECIPKQRSCLNKMENKSLNKQR